MINFPSISIILIDISVGAGAIPARELPVLLVEPIHWAVILGLPVQVCGQLPQALVQA